MEHKLTEETYKILYKVIYDLYLKVEEKVIAVKNKGALFSIPYERINACNLDFSFGYTSFQYDYGNIEHFNFYEWSNETFISFIDNEIKRLPEFEIAAEKLCKAFKIKDQDKRYVKEIGLFGFSRFLMNQIPNGIVTPENIEEYIKIFIKDYEIYSSNNLFTWHINAWLDNFELEGEVIKIEELTLRKPVIEELYITRPQANHIDELERMTSRSISSSCVMEFSQNAPTQVRGFYSDEIKHEIENCLDVLRLFKLGNVTVAQLSVSPSSILEHGHSESPESPFDKYWKDKIEFQHTSNYKYEVKKDEEAGLISFFQKVKPILKSISNKNYFNGNYLDLAFNRYKESLLRSEVKVNRMISAISCLEALLSDSQTEISYKISLHVAGLLKYFGFDSVKVFEKMRKAYNIRSRVLHGSELKDKDIEFSKNHTHEIINYARIALIVSLQLKDKFTDKSLVKKIDHALIDEKQFSELRKAIEENVIIPIIYPYRLITGGDDFMKKKIVCLGWGSLIWDPRELKIKGDWHKDGPGLPIEFVRESKDKRITLVIDKESKPVKTLWAYMDVEIVEDAIKSLKEREGGDSIDFVHATDVTEDPIKIAIRDWLQSKGINTAIWTGLKPKFNSKSKRPTIEEIITHFKNLNGKELERAEEYIRKAPIQVKTQYRKRIEEELGWTPLSDR
ncbi:MAG: hypothetical protein ACXVPN_01740 [Bacteroidia bacterium]